MNIFEYLKEEYPYWGWMGQRAHDASAINSVLPLDFILCCDHGLDVPLYFNENKIFSLEKKIEVRKNWSNEHLKASLEGGAGRVFFEYIGALKGIPNILCYRSISTLEKKAESYQCRILAPKESKKNFFDNKILLNSRAPALGLESIPGKTGITGLQDFKGLSEELSLPFVIRFPYGSSGEFTFMVREEEDYNAIIEKYPANMAIFQRFVKGIPLNVNAVIIDVPEGVKTVCSFPSVQLTGIPECSNFSFSFCGNDFASAGDLGEKVINKVKTIAGILGRWMGKLGFRGIFGMDLIVSGNKIYAIEINPRFQNSTALFDTLKGLSGDKKHMLALLHILQFLQRNDIRIRRFLEKYSYDELMSPLRGAQIILHSKATESKIQQTVLPGIYVYNGNKIQYERPQAVLSEKENEDDILITCAIPEQGRTVEYNSPLCKIQSLKSVLDTHDKLRLSNDSARIVEKVYSGFGFEGQ